MSEEAAALARHDEHSEPLGAGDGAALEGAADDIAGAGEYSPQVGAEQQGDALDDGAPLGSHPAAVGDGASDPITAAVGAADSQLFLRGLIGALAHDGQLQAGDETSLGIVLCQLGQALIDAQDEELALQELVDALDRRRLGSAALRDVAPIVAAFVARIVAAPRLQGGSETIPAEIESLVHAAEEVADGALNAGGARAWRRLPDIAAAITHRLARRDLSIGALAEALPRLATRLGLGPRDAVATDMDHSRGSLLRGGAAGEPRRMVISGPVEIVILDR